MAATTKVPTPKLLSLQAVAEMLNINQRTVRRLITTGELRGYRIGGKIVRVRADDVHKLLKPIVPGDSGAA